MINPTKIIEMTVTEHASQLWYCPDPCYNANLFITRVPLGKMYLHKYDNKYYLNHIHTFKVETC